MSGFGWQELLIVLAIVFLLFGAKKLPEMARSLGRSSREFKKGMSDVDDEEKPDSTPGSASEPPSENKNN